MDNYNQSNADAAKIQSTKQTPKKNSNILAIALGVVCVIMLALFIMQLTKTGKLSAQIAEESVKVSELEELVADKDKKITEQKNQISDLEKNNKELSAKADKYDNISSLCVQYITVF